MFVYEQWPLYRLALELKRLVRIICLEVPRGYADDLNHLKRSSSSVVFNLTEGATHFSPGKKLEFYRLSLGSIGECNGVLETLLPVARRCRAIPAAQNICNRYAGMMTNLINSIEGRER